MWDKFGELGSCEEINKVAAAELAEGDRQALMALAAENGIDQEDAQDYMDGITQELCTPLMAALGKLAVEEKDLQPYEIMADWVEYIRIRCVEEEEMARAVRRKGNTLRGCIAALLKWSYANAKDVDKEILKASGVTAPRVTLGIPGMATARRLITEYYRKGGQG